MTALPTGPGTVPQDPRRRRWLAVQPPAARLPWRSTGAVLFIQLVGSQLAGHNQSGRGLLRRLRPPNRPPTPACG
ncbi:hypothetical protein [Streptomyces sp. NBC_01803]|uniref:hypothetical protein n=1 Tax=Streptomyces sp. NBC_01803 TaxID=2975946 RepID=UPI002DDA8BF2|nr:hypothetical protein [Streptomyces sp. NBC_01803]WSA42842.1 hypothetical protein OIE51_00655 [Streptomyces sp. NBC_01803]